MGGLLYLCCMCRSSCYSLWKIPDGSCIHTETLCIQRSQETWPFTPCSQSYVVCYSHILSVTVICCLLPPPVFLPCYCITFFTLLLTLPSLFLSPSPPYLASLLSPTSVSLPSPTHLFHLLQSVPFHLLAPTPLNQVNFEHSEHSSC